MKTAAPISLLVHNSPRPVMYVHSSIAKRKKYRVLLPFIKGGFECGHKAVHVVNAHQRREHMERLQGSIQRQQNAVAN